MTTKAKKPVIRARTYARFSNPKLQDYQSILDQQHVCGKLAEREGYTVEHQYVDAGINGAKFFKRPAIQQLLEDAKNKLFDVLVVEGLDRMSRDMAHPATLYKKLVFAGVKIHAVDWGIITEMHITMAAMINSSFRKTLGNKVRREQIARVERDGLVPGAVRYGYSKTIVERDGLAVSDPGVRSIDKGKAKIVRRIFDDFVAGVSMRDIAKALTDERVPSPSGAATWCKATINSMLTCELYGGRLRWNYTTNTINPETEMRTAQRSAAGEVIHKDMPHLAIVSRETWDKAAALRASRSIGDPAQKRLGRAMPRNAYLFAGLFRCPDCGGDMTRQRGGGKCAVYLSCANAGNHGTCDHTRSYSLTRLQSLVLENLKPAFHDPVALQTAAKAYRKEAESNRKKTSTNSATARRELQETEKQIERLMELAQFGTMPVASLGERMKALQGRKLAAAEKVRGAEGEVGPDLHPDAIERFCKWFADMCDHPDLHTDPKVQATFAAHVDRITVHKVGKFQPYRVEVSAKLADMLGLAGKPLTERHVSARKPLKNKGSIKSDIANAECLPLAVSRTPAVLHLGVFAEPAGNYHPRAIAANRRQHAARRRSAA